MGKLEMTIGKKEQEKKKAFSDTPLIPIPSESQIIAFSSSQDANTFSQPNTDSFVSESTQKSQQNFVVSTIYTPFSSLYSQSASQNSFFSQPSFDDQPRKRGRPRKVPKKLTIN